MRAFLYIFLINVNAQACLSLFLLSYHWIQLDRLFFLISAYVIKHIGLFLSALP